MDVIEKKLRERGENLELLWKKNLYNNFPPHSWADVIGYEISLSSVWVSCPSSVPCQPLLHPQPLFFGEGLLETQPWYSVGTAKH